MCASETFRKTENIQKLYMITAALGTNVSQQKYFVLISQNWEPWDQYHSVPPTFMTGCNFYDPIKRKVNKIVAKNATNSMSAAALPQTSLWAYSAPSDPLAGFETAYF